MSKKQLISLIVIAVVVIAIVVFGLVSRQKGESLFSPGVGSGPGGTPEEMMEIPESGYTSGVPENAVLTPPKSQAPASANPELNTKQRFFDLRATKNGFEPNSFTVNKGDSVTFDFTAVDADYDLDFPFLGAYFSVVKKGETKRLPFDTSLAGTFAFECRDYCPSGKVIKGQLIVLP